MAPKIPKIIHLCWFSGDEYPEGIKECLDSWKRIIPDYQVKLWTKEMALATGIPFVKEAIEQRKWAFAADVIRLYALYHDGGVYADSDILFLKRFDEYLTNDLVLFHEYTESYFKRDNPKNMFDEEGHKLIKGVSVFGLNIQAAFMISKGHHPFVKELLDLYGSMHFEKKEDHQYKGMVSPKIYAMELEKYGYRYVNEIQHISPNITVYPSECVGVNNSVRYPESFAVHCVAHSWYPPSKKDIFIIKMKRIIKRILFMKDKAAVKSFYK